MGSTCSLLCSHDGVAMTMESGHITMSKIYRISRKHSVAMNAAKQFAFFRFEATTIHYDYANYSSSQPFCISESHSLITYTCSIQHIILNMNLMGLFDANSHKNAWQKLEHKSRTSGTKERTY